MNDEAKDALLCVRDAWAAVSACVMAWAEAECAVLASKVAACNALVAGRSADPDESMRAMGVLLRRRNRHRAWQRAVEYAEMQEDSLVPFIPEEPAP